MDSIRLSNTLKDLLKLKANYYADLGPGQGFLSRDLKSNNKKVLAVEAPWAHDQNKNWANENDIKMYFLEFFQGDFNNIREDIDCFILAHSIAHFRFSPYILFEKIYNKLPKGGFFYLSTVNATSFENVFKFMKGQPVVQEISKKLDPGFEDVYRDFNKTDLRQIWDDWMHVKEYTKQELEKIFVESGFEIHDSFYRTNHNHWKKSPFIKLFPHLSEEIVVIGRKK